ILRARFRENVWGDPELMVPGSVYELHIEMAVTANLFKEGHRIKVYITSSNFPLWDRNHNTGKDPATDTEFQIAKQTIFHDSLRPSHVLLPVTG
ncbi:MAG TPA: CocE/NonD family hydrolase C-terminal non-catalytic domain-containing protein, partial [bacterium]|nr:CocE/NonD family hydrolase C-terminal non-catalytic domain-containing protein [bacterium]